MIRLKSQEDILAGAPGSRGSRGSRGEHLEQLEHAKPT